MSVSFPLAVISRVQGSYGLRKLRDLLVDREVQAFVVGMPFRSDGSMGEECEKVREYMHALRDYFGKEVIPWDERFTTVMARQVMIEAGTRKKARRKESGIADRIAAQLILQSYLDQLTTSHET
jgi:putative Holliday junction resolvase